MPSKFADTYTLPTNPQGHKYRSANDGVEGDDDPEEKVVMVLPREDLTGTGAELLKPVFGCLAHI